MGCGDGLVCNNMGNRTRDRCCNKNHPGGFLMASWISKSPGRRTLFWSMVFLLLDASGCVRAMNSTFLELSSCLSTEAQATYQCQSQDILTVARDGFNYPEGNLTHSRCLLHCEMCWDANWCPLSLNFSGLHSAGYNHNENLSNWSLSEIFEPNQYSNAQWLSQKMNLLFSNATVQKTLRYLILPFNNMTGNISTLEGLQSLQTLDLRNNKLFGNLDFLSRIRSLNSLNVSYNSKLSMTPFLFSKRFGSSSFLGTEDIKDWPKPAGLQLPPSKGSVSSGHSRRMGEFIGLTFGIVAIAVLIVTALLYFLREGDDSKVLSKSPSLGAKALGSMRSLTLTYEDLSQATLSFDEGHLLGNGILGELYKGSLYDGTAIVVRRLQRGNLSKSCGGQLQALYRTLHPNCLVLRTDVKYKKSTFLVYDYVPNGSLEVALHVRKPDEAPLPWSTRLSIASGVAQALAYLHHDCTPPIFHYNLTARNVLIDVDLEAKLSDIGLFQFAPASRAKALAAVAKSGYAAPEYLDIWGMPEKVDVYSFGILLLELLTGKKPRDFVQLSEQSDLATWVRGEIDSSQACTLIDPQVKSSTSCSDRLHQVLRTALQCTVAVPLHRPTMKEVVKVLQAFIPS